MVGQIVPVARDCLSHQFLGFALLGSVVFIWEEIADSLSLWLRARVCLWFVTSTDNDVRKLTFCKLFK